MRGNELLWTIGLPGPRLPNLNIVYSSTMYYWILVSGLAFLLLLGLKFEIMAHKDFKSSKKTIYKENQ